MPVIDFDTERTYEEERFSAQEVFRTEHSKVVCGYFEPGQFIPVHVLASDVGISVRSGTSIVCEDEKKHRVSSGDVVVIEGGTARGIRANEDERLEALLVTAPPPSDVEHESVRKGIQRGEFDPTVTTTSGNRD